MATHALGEKAVLLRSEDDVAVAKAELAAGTMMYRHMTEDMDINCGVVLEGTPIATVGRQIFEEVIAVASGKRSKSELSGVGEEEFAPWIIGPVM
jgi:altronate hydrolase